MKKKKFKVTINNYGVMHGANYISKKFIEDALLCKGTVLDIGCAYGVATIPILCENETVKVIACDIDNNHLDSLVKSLRAREISNKSLYLPRLTVLNKKFPDFDLDESSLDAVLISHVLPFLDGKDIELGIKKIARFLKPKGKLYITSYSIYNDLMKNYIPTYENRKLMGENWPGELKDASLFWCKDNPLTKVLPTKLNHIEPCLIEPILLENNFDIQYLDFLESNDEIPNEIKLNGKETVGIIACLGS